MRPLGIIPIIIGLVLIIYRKPLSKYQIEAQNSFWGFKFGQKSIERNYIFFGVVGVIVIIMGLLFLLGIGKIKQ